MDEPSVSDDGLPLPDEASAVWDSPLPDPALRVPDLAAANEAAGRGATSQPSFDLPDNIWQPDWTGGSGPVEAVTLSQPLPDVEGPAPGESWASEADEAPRAADSSYTLPAGFLTVDEPVGTMGPVTLPASAVESGGSLPPRPEFPLPSSRAEAEPGVGRWVSPRRKGRSAALVAMSAAVAAVVVGLVVSKGPVSTPQQLDAGAIPPPATSTVPGTTLTPLMTVLPPTGAGPLPNDANTAAPPAVTDPTSPGGAAPQGAGPTFAPSPGRAPTAAVPGPVSSPSRANNGPSAADPHPAPPNAAPPASNSGPPANVTPPPADAAPPATSPAPPPTNATPPPTDAAPAPTEPPRNRRDPPITTPPVVASTTTLPDIPRISLPGKACLAGDPPRLVTCDGAKAP